MSASRMHAPVAGTASICLAHECGSTRATASWTRLMSGVGYRFARLQQSSYNSLAG